MRPSRKFTRVGWRMEGWLGVRGAAKKERYATHKVVSCPVTFKVFVRAIVYPPTSSARDQMTSERDWRRICSSNFCERVMAATERTPLTRPTDPPTYVEFAGILRARRSKLRQFQCCVCAFLLWVVSPYCTTKFLLRQKITTAYRKTKKYEIDI